jgi:hypothetical protein
MDRGIGDRIELPVEALVPALAALSVLALFSLGFL